MRGREKFAKFKPIMNILVKLYSVFPRKLRIWDMERLRKKTGTIALVKRYCLLKTLAKSVGDNVSVYTDVYLKNIHEMEIGSNVSFQPMVYIEAYGGVKIGDDVSLAEGVSVFSVNHGYKEIDKPIKDQKLIPGRVIIENNVWIGSKATVLADTIIQTGAIVAAGAVVTKDVMANTIVAGVPASKIGER